MVLPALLVSLFHNSPGFLTIYPSFSSHSPTLFCLRLVVYDGQGNATQFVELAHKLRKMRQAYTVSSVIGSVVQFLSLSLSSFFSLSLICSVLSSLSLVARTGNATRLEKLVHNEETLWALFMLVMRRVCL